MPGSRPGVEQRLVEGGVRRYGRWAARPAAVDPLEEFPRLSRRLRSLRLKEWVGFTLVHPDWYSSLIIQDAHYLSSSEIYAYDRARRVLHQQASASAGSIGLPAGLFGERVEYRRRGYRLSYDLATPGGGRHRLRFEIAGTAQAPSFEGELELDGREASPPLSVSSRLPGGRRTRTRSSTRPPAACRSGAGASSSTRGGTWRSSTSIGRCFPTGRTGSGGRSQPGTRAARRYGRTSAPPWSRVRRRSRASGRRTRASRSGTSPSRTGPTRSVGGASRPPTAAST